MITLVVVINIAIACVTMAGFINAIVGGCHHDEWDKKICEKINDTLAITAYLLLAVLCFLAIILMVRR